LGTDSTLPCQFKSRSVERDSLIRHNRKGKLLILITLATQDSALYTRVAKDLNLPRLFALILRCSFVFFCHIKPSNCNLDTKPSTSIFLTMLLYILVLKCHYYYYHHYYYISFTKLHLFNNLIVFTRDPHEISVFKTSTLHMYVEHWWLDTETTKTKSSERNLSHCHFVYHKSHMD
jgi:hypothetical protein